MEVDANLFPHRLLEILTNISEAEFVSLDFELTGIPSRLPELLSKPRTGQRCSLEERYQEARTAADRYQIIQVGITCGRFDYAANNYVLHPYNILLSPLVDERLDIEREVTIQSGAASFLLKHNFDFGAPFAKGVQYVSREEAARAKQMAYDRIEKKNDIEDLQLRKDDVDSLDFMRRVRQAITDWVKHNEGPLDITTHTGLAEQPPMPVISRFEKRLVHQLVRAEYSYKPKLVSMGRSECVRIIFFNDAREADNIQRAKNRTNESIARQTGFRYVAEALMGGNIDGADPFPADLMMNVNVIAADTRDVKDRFDRTRDRLKGHRPVLVGHNVFTDLVYFYRTFVGPLPETLNVFCAALHTLCPRIIDTKYLATHAEGDLHASPTLQEIAGELQRQALPRIAIHADHPKYNEITAFHEAGYDSLLTATTMLRLAAQLGKEYPEPSSLSKTSQASTGVAYAKVQATSTAKNVRPRFESKTMFDRLSELSIESESANNQEPMQGMTHDHPGKDMDINHNWRDPMELIPTYDSKFWQEFGNTLRIFGTQEALLRIGEWKS